MIVSTNVWLIVRKINEIPGAWEDTVISLFLVLFGGLMSGLTLGLMSLDLVELEVLRRSGSPREQKQAAAVLPVIRNQHQLLVTLVLCNAVAMEALPVFLDNMFSTLVAVILSVTFVLAFGEIIPQAICSRNGLAIGAYLGWLVRILMFICFPIAYPIGKLLDFLLGKNHTALFRRHQLKAFVSIHGKEEGKGGELSQNETNIIAGALDLSLKTAVQAMTPINSTFSLNITSKLDWKTLRKIIATGHSRIPVYSGNKNNLIGIILVKNLITVHPEDETPVSSVHIRELPRVWADTPLYDVLNEFQKGRSHMAAVVNRNAGRRPAEREAEDDVDRYECKVGIAKQSGWEGRQEETSSLTAKHDDIPEEEVVLGIITLEDVFEELIQGEIIDETDQYIDVQKRTKVAALVATTMTANNPPSSPPFPHCNNGFAEWRATLGSTGALVGDLRRPLLSDKM